MMPSLIYFAVASIWLVLIMTAAWVTQRINGNAGWSDAFWSYGLGIAGIGLALAPMQGADEATTRQIVVAGLVGFWSLRLGLHIAARAAKGVEDARYARFRVEWGGDFQRRLFLFLMIQVLAAIVLVVSIGLAAHNPAPAFRLQDWLAIGVLAVGVLGEGLADHQLARFKRQADNHGKICDVGLWSWSRHPNYFFEWLGWCAYPLFAIDFSGHYPLGWLALSGPAFMYWLLVHVSGIPPLEAHMMRSRPAAFAAYRARVGAFFPRPPS